MSKHTPGPWKLDRNSVLIPIAPYEWADAYGGSEANARLIAAAPDLLEALQDLCDTLGECGMTEKARAAITKAEGEAS
jgi:hypothetical protein